MHTWGAVRSIAGLVNLADLCAQGGISQLTGAGRAATPLVVTAGAHQQVLAHGIYGEGGLVCRNQRIDGVSASLL